jgi:hypothetical protein
VVFYNIMSKISVEKSACDVFMVQNSYIKRSVTTNLLVGFCGITYNQTSEIE